MKMRTEAEAERWGRLRRADGQVANHHRGWHRLPPFVALMLHTSPHDDPFIALLESLLKNRAREGCAAASATAGLTGRAKAEELRVAGRPWPCTREPCSHEYSRL